MLVRVQLPIVRRRGVGQPSFDASAALPDVSQLPQSGNLSSQLSYGQNLLDNAKQAISSGSPSAIANLLNAGVTVAQGMGSGEAGTIVRDIMTIAGATAAGAVGGPIGAAAGLVISSIEVLFQSIFGGGGGGNVSYPPGQPTQAAQNLAQRIAQWIQQTGHLGQESLNPQGWTFYDYLARKYPPNQVSDSDAKTMWDQVVWSMENLGSGATLTQFGGIWNAGPAWQIQNQYSGTKWQAYKKVVQPLCTPIIWDWSQPSTIQNCSNNEYFGSNPSTSDLYSLWQNDAPGNISNGLQTITTAQIMAYAEAHRPKSLFFASDLYVWQQPNRNQIFNNLETLCGLASAMGILTTGGSVQSVSAELCLQQKTVHDLNGGQVPPLFRLLVEDYLSKAQAERAAAAKTASGLQSSSTGEEIGAVLGGAALAGVVGILGYSAYTRQSPVAVVQSIIRRILP